MAFIVTIRPPVRTRPTALDPMFGGMPPHGIGGSCKPEVDDGAEGGAEGSIMGTVCEVQSGAQGEGH